MRPEQDLREKEKLYRSALCSGSELVAHVFQIAQEYRSMIEEKQAEQLDHWLMKVEQSQIIELKRFSTSLRTDYAAIKSALLFSWSNGQVEGQVNRLKLIKRAMYGRANFDLLRRRVLGPPALI